MAKKNKEDKIQENGEKGEKGGSRIITVIIALVIVIIWLGVFALLIKLDVGGFGSNVLRPILKDVPIISQILPAGSDEEYAKDNEYPYKNLAEAIAKIKELEAQLDSVNKSGTANSDYIDQLTAEITRLRVFEDNQKEFEERQKEFDKEVVFNNNAPDISEYAKYYEGINPENAEEIYAKVIEQQQVDKKIIEQAGRYAKMEPAAAAEILEIMTAGDLDLVCGILSNMKQDQSALILAEMERATAAQITKKMALVK